MKTTRFQFVRLTFLLGISISMGLFAFFAPSVIQEATAAPTCKIDEMTDSQGRTCWVCVVDGAGATCECGGKLCFL